MAALTQARTGYAGPLLMRKKLGVVQKRDGRRGGGRQLNCSEGILNDLCCYCRIGFKPRKMLILCCLFIVFTITKWLAFKLITITKGTFCSLNVPCSSLYLHFICCFVAHFVGPHPFRKQMGSELINRGAGPIPLTLGC